MPNHILSVITLHDTPLSQVTPLIYNDQARIDFEVLLPLPLNIWRGGVSRDHEEAFPSTGLTEARRIWGTKWNAYGEPKAEQVGTDTVITLQTAWSHPRGWTAALFNSLRCRITAEWLDEGSEDGWRETYTPDKCPNLGDDWTKERIASGTDDQKRLHLLLWGVEEFGDDE